MIDSIGSIAGDLPPTVREWLFLRMRSPALVDLRDGLDRIRRNHTCATLCDHSIQDWETEAVRLSDGEVDNEQIRSPRLGLVIQGPLVPDYQTFLFNCSIKNVWLSIEQENK